VNLSLSALAYCVAPPIDPSPTSARIEKWPPPPPVPHPPFSHPISLLRQPHEHRLLLPIHLVQGYHRRTARAIGTHNRCDPVRPAPLSHTSELATTDWTHPLHPPRFTGAAGPPSHRRRPPEHLHHLGHRRLVASATPHRRPVVRVSPADHHLVRHHPGARLVLAGYMLPPASHHSITGECVTAPSCTRAARGDRAVSAPSACAPSSCRGPLPWLDRAARPKPIRLFGRLHMVGCRIEWAVAPGWFEAQHCAKLKFHFLICLIHRKCSKL
jgi:hypothetical protein